jgi:hypothetical protein
MCIEDGFYNSYKNDMFVELYVSNYATSYGLVNGVNGIFKTSTTYCEKLIIWIIFRILKLEQ